MYKILDAHPLMAFLEREPGGEKVEAILLEAAAKGYRLLMTSVNLGEVFYSALRVGGPDHARDLESVIPSLPLEIVEVDWFLAREAAKLKAAYKMSYADCFAAALAKVHEGEVITGDKEFRQVEDEIRVYWV